MELFRARIQTAGCTVRSTDIGGRALQRRNVVDCDDKADIIALIVPNRRTVE